ncbi:DNA-directed RNA polymerase subunit B [Candidatus Micrarchaeota archaeon CG_4_10_14_0_2_um_filter_55_9]|nr:MAG: DNA-directed RNA polymerase subunit B [Candidatus Micrarchaeota archaeon CG1_02_55_41]PIO02080.1 MAG: DNA-directed RNA polymerase subunit B [Candidatus Micrarchaeota archaeon CG09_land_8_20_14_0_10_55_25]PIZ91467.1 MAG: DNA-directed RNA polymerase subunit B [Candidatus Micrarchaeota archaeon CG_4_10_14_0_2_um_filter_55_9]PJD01500.1 MAG: DNA-directed RNA polymerase subunit B [Candidatus Micrarchaeota archaeon CG10_big_fil_rev_8_21_14_0_10_54_18]
MKTSIFLNGRFTGFHDDGEVLAEEIRGKRREGKMDSEVNVAYYQHTNEVFVNTDEGRARRPLIVVEKGKSSLTPEHVDRVRRGELGWKDLVKNGVIEFLDAEEEENTLIALKEEDLTADHTHLEIDASNILGYASSQIPFPEYNMAPRVLMAAQHTKQSLGLYAANYNLRADTRAHLLYYPQQPLIQTRVYREVENYKRSSGQNLVVAVMTYEGFNTNDAIVVNRNAIERAMARSAFFRTYSATESRYPGGQNDRFCVPDATVQNYLGEEAYAALDEDGTVSPETLVKKNSVLIGRTSPPRFLKEINALDMEVEKRRESSVMTRGNEDGIVDAVIISKNTSGNKMFKVRVRNPNVPEIGDKFASRFGQKGVISLLVPQEDLPFTREGIVPDLILNPHAIPGRMTAGHLLEMLGGKACSLSGRIGDGTAFSGDKQKTFEDELRAYGLEPTGKEVLYDGKTGKKLYAKIYVGVIYYQRLHHLVNLKMHARSRGPTQMLTHQPTEGRAREGGLRLGEMERDCFIGYGAASLLKERMIDSSDKAVMYVCRECGSLGYYDRMKNKPKCSFCKSTRLDQVEMSYAFKLLIDEMKSTGIRPKLNLRDRG